MNWSGLEMFRRNAPLETTINYRRVRPSSGFTVVRDASSNFRTGLLVLNINALG